LLHPIGTRSDAITKSKQPASEKYKTLRQYYAKLESNLQSRTQQQQQWAVNCGINLQASHTRKQPLCQWWLLLNV